MTAAMAQVQNNYFQNLINLMAMRRRQRRLHTNEFIVNISRSNRANNE